MENSKDIHFFISTVGGTGKSSLALMASEMFDAKMYDGSLSETFISGFEGVDAFKSVPVNINNTIYDSVNNIMLDIIDYMYDSDDEGNPIIKKDIKNVVVDLDSSLTIAFLSFIESNLFMQTFENAGGGKCYIHFIYSPEALGRSEGYISMFYKRADLLSDNSVFIWKNEYKISFLDKEYIAALIDVAKMEFGDKFGGSLSIEKSEAIKPVFRKYIYEAKVNIFTAYYKMNIFDKGKMRSYYNRVASYFEESGFTVRKIEPQLKTPFFGTGNIVKEMNSEDNKHKLTDAIAKMKKVKNTQPKDTASETPKKMGVKEQRRDSAKKAQAEKEKKEREEAAEEASRLRLEAEKGRETKKTPAPQEEYRDPELDSVEMDTDVLDTDNDDLSIIGNIELDSVNEEEENVTEKKKEKESREKETNAYTGEDDEEEWEDEEWEDDDGKSDDDDDDDDDDLYED